jgi:hypothetical protein
MANPGQGQPKTEPATVMARPGFVRLVVWGFPDGERLSHRGQDWAPRRDVGHVMEKHRSLVDVPEQYAAEIVAMTPMCERAD